MKLLTITASILLALPTALFAQTQNFLKIEGPDIDGESLTSDYEKQLSILAYDLNLSRDISIDNPSASSPTYFTPLSFTSFVDSKALPKLVKSAALGTRHEKLTLTSLRETGSGLVKFSEIILEDAFFVEVSLSGTSGDVPVYSFAVEYTEITVTTYVINPSTGESTTDPTLTFTFDRAPDM